MTTTGCNFTCRCGEVKVSITGEPKAVCFCHCNECRKLAGAPFIEGCVMGPDDVKVEGPVKDSVVIEPHDDGKGMIARHCEKCHEFLGNFNKFGLLNIPAHKIRSVKGFSGVKAGIHIFMKERRVDVDDTLPKFKDLPEAFGGTNEMHDGSSLEATTPIAEVSGSLACYCGESKVTIKGELKAACYCHCVECRAISNQPMVEGCVMAPDSCTFEGPIVESVVKDPTMKIKACEKCHYVFCNTNKFELCNFPEGKIKWDEGVKFAPAVHLFWKERCLPGTKDDKPKFLDLPEAFGGSNKMFEAGATTPRPEYARAEALGIPIKNADGTPRRYQEIYEDLLRKLSDLQA